MMDVAALASDRIVEVFKWLMAIELRVKTDLVLAHFVTVVALRFPVVDQDIVHRQQWYEIAFVEVCVEIQPKERVYGLAAQAADHLDVRTQRSQRIGEVEAFRNGGP